MSQALTAIGYTRKTYGLQGLLKLRIEEQFLEDFLQAEVVFITQKGHPLPFFIEEVVEKGQLMVKLEEVDTKEAAQALTSCELFLRDKDILPDDERTYFPTSDLQFAFLVDYQLEDLTKGLIGPILDVLEYPQQEMALVNYQSKELLIPLNEQLIASIKEEQKIIQVDLPEGLLDL